LSAYYIRAATNEEETIFSFDSTSEIEITENGRATSFPLANGKQATDHYVNSNTIITFSGLISDIKNRTSRQSSNTHQDTSDFIKYITRLKQSGVPFSVHVGDKLDIYDSCVFESLTVKQDNVNGTITRADYILSSYRLSFTAKKLRFGSRAELTKAPADIMRKMTAIEQAKAASNEAVDAAEVTDYGFQQGRFDYLKRDRENTLLFGTNAPTVK